MLLLALSSRSSEFPQERQQSQSIHGWSVWISPEQQSISLLDNVTFGEDTDEHPIDDKWDLHIVERSFSSCTEEAWLNDTARIQALYANEMDECL